MLKLRIDGAESNYSSQEREQLREESQKTLSPKTLLPQEEPAVVPDISPPTGRSLQDGTNDLIATQARDAAAAIIRIREEELKILEVSKNEPFGAGTETREDAVADLEQEISRIESAATVNGQSALRGATLIASYSDGEVPRAVGLPKISTALDGAARLDNQTQTQAEADIELIEDSIISLTSTLSAYENGTSRTAPQGYPADNAITGTSIRTSSTPGSDDTVRDPEAAAEIAKKIAATLITPYATERQRGALINASADGLSDERVSLLVA